MHTVSLTVVGVVIGIVLALGAVKLWAKFVAWRSTRVTLHTRVEALEKQLAEKIAVDAAAVAAKT